MDIFSYHASVPHHTLADFFTQAPFANSCALTIGNFDGVHLGHQAMLNLLCMQAKQKSLSSCVLTFAPHPLDYFSELHQNIALAPQHIGSLDDKLHQLEKCGIDQCVVLPFNAELANLSALDFVQKITIEKLNAVHVLIGDDFRFGFQRQGDFNFLKKTAANFGVDVVRMESHEIAGIRVSSSAVRLALQQGDLVKTRHLLGRTCMLSGTVVKGRQLGRTLNCRTLNIPMPARMAAQGIFVVLIHGLFGDVVLKGVANLGERPSLSANDVNGGKTILEVHCLNWPDALGIDGGYDRWVQIELLHKLHDEIHYQNLQSLQEGIARDCAAARAFFE